MTNQQGAPEALRPEMLDDLIEAFATAGLGRHNLMRVELPRYQWAQLAVALSRLHAENERLAALVEALQSAPADAVVAGDEQKALKALHYYMTECSGHEPSISVFHRMVEEALVPHPSPAPQADSAPSAAPAVGSRHPTVVHWRNDGIEACAGIAEAYGLADAARDMRAMITATAPQADSQPAPVRDYPPLPEQVAWRDSFEHYDLYWRPVVQEHNDLEPLFTDKQMRAYVDADRAARAPADSVTAPAYSIDADPQGIRAQVAETITGALAFGAQGANPPPPGHWLAPFWESARWEAIRAKPVHPSADTLYLLRRLLSNQHTLTGSEFREELGKIVEDAHALTPPAQAADSVLEDAARYQWLRQNWFTMSSNYQRCITFKLGEPRWSDFTEAELDAAIDAAMDKGGAT